MLLLLWLLLLLLWRHLHHVRVHGARRRRHVPGCCGRGGRLARWHGNRSSRRTRGRPLLMNELHLRLLPRQRLPLSLGVRLRSVHQHRSLLLLMWLRLLRMLLVCLGVLMMRLLGLLLAVRVTRVDHDDIAVRIIPHLHAASRGVSVARHGRPHEMLRLLL